MIRAAQPDEFFPWLAKVVGLSGAFSCSRVRCSAQGELVFVLRKKDHEEVTVRWCIGRRRGEGRWFRDGELRADGGSSRESRRAALDQVEARLEALLSRASPPLLCPRNRHESEIVFDETTLERVFGGLLVPGETRVGGVWLREVEFCDGGLDLRFEGEDGKRVARLQPRMSGSSVGQKVASIGPFDLFALGLEQGEAPGRAMEFVGYVTALSIHEEIHIAEPAPDISAKIPLGDKANPFLFDGISCGGVVMTAFFASRGRSAVVLHADRECTGFASYLTGITETVYLHQRGLRPTIDYLRNLRIVDTTELDAIMTGCQQKLTSLVEGTIHEYDPDLLLVMGTCVSRVIGDDVKTAVDDSGAEERGTPVVWMETTATERDQHHRILWRRLVELFQGPRSLEEKPAVNLLGYGSWRTESMPELERLIESSGIRRNATMMPTFDVDELKHFGEADANLVLPSVHNRDSLLWARPLLRAPVIEPPAPYGMQGSLAWIETIRDFFGFPPPSQPWLAEHVERHRHRWAALVDQASRHRVGLVLTADHFGSEEPLLRSGLPWFAVLQEMGFSLDVLIIPAQNRAPAPHDRKEMAEALTKVLVDGRDHHLVWLSSLDGLPEALASSDAELLYSEVPGDRQATSAGMFPINHTDFHMGFEGACRTLERLLGKVRPPFYRRYQRHLRVPGPGE